MMKKLCLFLISVALILLVVVTTAVFINGKDTEESPVTNTNTKMILTGADIKPSSGDASSIK